MKMRGGGKGRARALSVVVLLCVMVFFLQAYAGLDGDLGWVDGAEGAILLEDLDIDRSWFDGH